MDTPVRYIYPPELPQEWHTLSELRSCSQVGCKLCDFMLRLLYSELDSDRIASLNRHQANIRIKQHSDARIDLLIPKPQVVDRSILSISDLDYVCRQLVCGNSERKWLANTKTDSVQQLYHSHAATTDHTGSDETIRHIHAWLKSCDQHSRCREWQDLCSVKSGFLPSRLIEIHKEDSHFTLKVVDAPPLGDDSRYCALSYCWGSHQTARLRVDNLEAYHHSVPWSDLPLTIQHAVDLVWRLGMKYLWVDALCIIQDDRDNKDWKREAPIMDQVYLHAYVAIAATASSDSSKGLYRSRDPYLLRSVVVQQRPGQASYTTIHRQGQPVDVKLSPLTKRSWVVQERILATRTIHFASTQVFWECQQGATSESFHPAAPLLLDLHLAQRRHLLPGPGEAHLGAASKFSKAWRQIANDYARGRMTYDTDRPVALAALSRLCTQLLSISMGACNCIHGMWDLWLEHDLLWHAFHFAYDHESTLHPRSKNVPTWSWLSINGAAIEWDFHARQPAPLIELLGISDEPRSAMAGEVSISAGLVLRARLCQVWLIFTSGDESDGDPVRSKRSIRPYMIMWQASTPQEELQYNMRPAYIDDIDSLEWLRQSSARRQCCYLMQAGSCPGFSSSLLTDLALILRQESFGHFTRLGMMTWNWQDMEESDVVGIRWPRLPDTAYLAGDAALVGQPRTHRVSAEAYKQYFEASIIPDGVCGPPDEEHHYTFVLN